MEVQPITLLSQEKNFLDCNLSFNSKNFKCGFSDINNEKIKINIISNDNAEKFEIILCFDDFKKLNRYFKMFDTLKELENDLIRLNNSNKIEIANISEKNLKICINALTLDNNKVIIELNKIELNDKDKINKLLKENEDIKKELKNKDIKISNLENEIKILKNEFINFKNTIEKKFNNNNSFKNINFSSDIFFNEEEKKLVLNQISNNINSIKLLFSSKLYGEDVNKLKEAYLYKPNLIFAIMTKKGRRFGAYSSEIFIDNTFEKKDPKAFLFSLDHKKIMKSKNTDHSIWKQSVDSIDFGDGSDIRIFYDFYSKQNYTRQRSGYDYSYCQDYILNGEFNFSINILEIFQISL